MALLKKTMNGIDDYGLSFLYKTEQMTKTGITNFIFLLYFKILFCH